MGTRSRTPADTSAGVPFPWVPGVRWATLFVGLTVAVARGPLLSHNVAWGLGLFGWALLTSIYRRKSRRTPGWAPGPASSTGAMIDVGLNIAAVVSTGYWKSPFVFCLLAAIIASAATRGFGFGLRATAASLAAIAVPYQITGEGIFTDRIMESGQWAVELLLVVLLAGYARYLFGQAEERDSAAKVRLNHLAEANDLLVSLHRVAQSLPASLNLEQVMVSTLTRLRTLVDYDVAALLLRDEASDRWVVHAADGVPTGRSYADTDLPPSLLAATSSSVASLVVVLAPGDGLGPEMLARSGLYAPLRARGALVGLLAMEHSEAGHYGRRDLRLLDGFIDPVALAIDNARWFARLRTMGADEERVRIARDIHDSVGQSLAYVAFRLDTAVKLAEDEMLKDELDGLRGEVRSVLAEVRDTLCDLRTDVSEERGLAETLGSFLERVKERGDLEVTFHDESTARLPVVREREFWRIAQEAITNVERHAQASHLGVRWTCDGKWATLLVADDGRGFSPGISGRRDSYGIQGMQERADAIGATLSIESEPYTGTIVECRLEP